MVTLNEMDKMLTITELSQLLNVHINTIRRWSNQGIIKTYRIGPRGDRRFRQDDVTHFLSGTKNLNT
jgi:excisionase family DNA binding protein